MPEVHVVLEQIEQELSKNNNLRAEIVNLNSTVQYEKRKNNFSQEKNDLLHSEIEKKNSTIKMKNLTIHENDVKATKKIEKQRMTYKEDRDNLLRYVIEQNEIANDLSKTILFMRAVISTSNPYLPSDSDTITSFMPSSLMPIEEESSDDEEGSVDTSQHDYNFDLKTVISTGDNANNKDTEFEKSDQRNDTIKSDESDGGNSKKEQGDDENDGAEGEKDEAQVVGEENNNEERITDIEDKKGGEEKEEKKKKKEKENVNALDGVQNEEGKEGSVTELVIEGNKEELRSIMLRSKIRDIIHSTD